jgi:hypothetical protein
MSHITECSVKILAKDITKGYVQNALSRIGSRYQLTEGRANVSATDRTSVAVDYVISGTQLGLQGQQDGSYKLKGEFWQSGISEQSFRGFFMEEKVKGAGREQDWDLVSQKRTNNNETIYVFETN